ncbi:MAG: hypothetical protein Ct9H300mP29_8710 [Candidatus Neomarinimicrobiota bacterium]|nr:MAG: hypothetical protein Ct9H300mP29_8710 [Candidatus Neomarinimicrobiota bacterium]
MGAKTFGYYFLTSILAIITGLLLTNIIRPGVGVEFSGMGGDFDPASLNKPVSLSRNIDTNDTSEPYQSYG